MSGYLADDSNWDALTSDWNRLLDKYDIPYLHVNDFISANGIYKEKGWKGKEKGDLIPQVLDDFIEVVRRHTIIGIGIGIAAKHYREITKDVAKKSKPEVFCFERVIGGVMKILEEMKWNEPICMIFDDSEQYAMKAYANFSEIKKRRPEIKNRIGIIGFANDELIIPIQAADLLSYATQRLQDAGGQQAWLNHPQFSKLLQADKSGYGTAYLSELWDVATLDNNKDNLVAIGNGKPFTI